MHLVRVIQQARSAINLKSQPFSQQFLSSSTVDRIGTWLEFNDVEKTGEHDVEDCISIGSVETK